MNKKKTQIEIAPLSSLEKKSEQKSALLRNQNAWVLTLYGTAIGAGVLFLPITAGSNGPIALLLMVMLAFPLTYYSHRALTRFLLQSEQENANLTTTAAAYFGQTAATIITWLAFFAIYPILLIYSVAIINTVESFLQHQLHIVPPPRILLALLLITPLIFLIQYGEKMMLRVMTLLVFPFITMLVLFSLYLIPHWSSAFFTAALPPEISLPHPLMSIWFLIATMVFSFNHSPIIPVFVAAQKKAYPQHAERICNQILARCHGLMILTVLFFVCSSIFTLTPQQLIAAKKENITVLSYLANQLNQPGISQVIPLITLFAIISSFLGHYVMARDGIAALIQQAAVTCNKKIADSSLQRAVMLFMLISCWIIGTLNPSILGMIESFGGPIIAMLLFIMPIYAVYRIDVLKKYRRDSISNFFVLLIGVMAICAALFNLYKLLTK